MFAMFSCHALYSSERLFFVMHTRYGNNLLQPCLTNRKFLESEILLEYGAIQCERYLFFMPACTFSAFLQHLQATRLQALDTHKVQKEPQYWKRHSN